MTNGALDVGIFAPAEMLGLEEGKELLDSIQTNWERINAASSRR